MKAARGGSVEIVEEMLKHGADVHRASKRGETALMWAASGPGNNLPLAIASVDSALACSASGTETICDGHPAGASWCGYERQIEDGGDGDGNCGSVGQ